jgi:hypothetical protein
MKEIDESYNIGFQHGFLAAIAIDLHNKTSTFNDESKFLTFCEQKTAAREWAIAKGYLAAKLKKTHKISSFHCKTFVKQKTDARDWAILMGYLK